MNQPFAAVDDSLTLHLIEQCRRFGGFGRTRLVGERSAVFERPLREQTLLVETSPWAEASREGALAPEVFDAVIILDPPRDAGAEVLREVARRASRWLLVGVSQRTAPAGGTWDRESLETWCCAAGWEAVPFGPLNGRNEAGLPMVLCAPARRGDSLRSDAVLIGFVEWVAGFVRPNDHLVILGAPPESAVNFLWTQTEAGRIGVLEHQGQPLAVDWRCRCTDEASERPTIDVLVALAPDALRRDSALLTRLIPGGRLLVASNQDVATELAAEFGPAWLREETKEPLPGTSARFLALMRTPLEGDGAAYVETVFPAPGNPPPAIVDFGRYYRNPWLVHALIIGRFRMRSADTLARLCQAVLAGYPTDSADYGGALCVLAYQSIGGGRSAGTALLERIGAYLSLLSTNPHVWRWQISLQFALAKLDLMEGRYVSAESGFAACAAKDFRSFGVHLGTKCAEAAFLAGWLAWQRGDVAAATAAWRAGAEVHAQAGRVPLSEQLIDSECPASFEAGDGLREMTIIADHAMRCAQGLRAVAQWRRRGATRPDQIDRSFQNTIRDLQGFVVRGNHVAAERLAALEVERRDWAALLERERTDWATLLERERREWTTTFGAVNRTQAAYVFLTLGQREELAQLRRRLEERRSETVLAARPLAVALPVGGCRRLVIFGTGRAGEFAAEALGRHHEIVGFLDNDPARQGATLFGRPILAPADLGRLGFDGVLVASMHAAEIELQLRQMGVDQARVLPLHELMDRLIVFGAGGGGKKVWEALPRKEMILKFVDNDRRKHGTEFLGVPVIAAEELLCTDFRYIVIASMYRVEIERQLAQLGIPAEKILAVDPTRPPVVFAPPPGPDLLECAREIFGGFESEELQRVRSFGKQCCSAALLDFSPATLALGAALAAGGCRVTVFDSPDFIKECRAAGMTPELGALPPARAGKFSALVASTSESLAAYAGQMVPGQRLLALAGPSTPQAQLATCHLRFWYAPPRAWLAAEAAPR